MGARHQSESVLYVKRDTMHPKGWRLAWSHPDSESYVMAEGECSAIYYRTRAAAVAAGVARFGEHARNWPRHWA